MVKWVSRENRGNSKKSAMTEVKDEVTFASQIQVFRPFPIGQNCSVGESYFGKLLCKKSILTLLN